MRQPETGIEARRLYDDIVERAMRHAMRRVDRGVALEVAHDVACELVRRRVGGKDDPDDPRSFDGLIFRAVSNRLSNLRRSGDRRAAAERVHQDERSRTAPAWAEADGAVNARELSQLVETTIAEMPEVMREVFRLVREEERSYKDVAGVLGIAVGTVHTHLARANIRLRQAVQRYRAAVPAVHAPHAGHQLPRAQHD